MRIVPHTTDVGCRRVATLDIVVGGQFQRCAFAYALLLLDVFEAASSMTGCRLGGDTHILTVGHASNDLDAVN